MLKHAVFIVGRQQARIQVSETIQGLTAMKNYRNLQGKMMLERPMCIRILLFLTPCSL